MVKKIAKRGTTLFSGILFTALILLLVSSCVDLRNLRGPGDEEEEDISGLTAHRFTYNYNFGSVNVGAVRFDRRFPYVLINVVTEVYDGKRTVEPPDLYFIKVSRKDGTFPYGVPLWNTQADGGGAVWDFANSKVTKDTTIYAQWPACSAACRAQFPPPNPEAER